MKHNKNETGSLNSDIKVLKMAILILTDQLKYLLIK